MGKDDAPLSAEEGASSFVWSITTSKNIANKFHHVGTEMSWHGEENWFQLKKKCVYVCNKLYYIAQVIINLLKFMLGDNVLFF